MTDPLKNEAHEELLAERPDFEIGLALAGAISAGAYTAGVMDFLAQALEEWEKHRPDNAPRHRVQIRTVAGASAGAITGALGVVALSRGLRQETLTSSEEKASHRIKGQSYQSARCVMPILYDAWVRRPQMVASDKDAKDLLGLDDIDEKSPDGSSRAKKRATIISSALNAKLLDEIKDTGLACPDPAPARAAYPFLSKTMHVFMTISNLRGIPFKVNFGNATYGMQTHGDRFHYRIEGVGPHDWPEEPWLAKDKTTPLRIGDLPWTAGQKVEQGTAWDDYGCCALASAAFPGGLAPRTLIAPFDDYVRRQYPLPVPLDSVEPDFPRRLSTDTKFKFLNVDGGVINNNPFDYVEYAIRGYPRKGSDAGQNADRAVLMIAPFPEPPAFLPEDQPVPELVSIIRALFPTLINQARFRASELGIAMDPNIYSRFMISPRRSLEGQPPERYAIACGLLSGFGGFLNEKFRAHDYQLGRRNCQRFLMSTFGLPATHVAILKTPESQQVALKNGAEKASEAAPPKVPEAQPVTPKGRTGNASAPKPHGMIVPLLGDTLPEVALPHWPQMTGDEFRTLLARIESRLDKVVKPLIESQTKKISVRTAARAVVYFSHDRIMNYIEKAILADLVRRNQITGWDIPEKVHTKVRAELTLENQQDAPDSEEKLKEILEHHFFDYVRAILAVLIAGPARIDTIARLTNQDKAFVSAALNALGTLGEDCSCRVVRRVGGEPETYMLQMHVRQGIRALPFLGGVIERWRPSPYPYA